MPPWSRLGGGRLAGKEHTDLARPCGRDWHIRMRLPLRRSRSDSPVASSHRLVTDPSMSWARQVPHPPLAHSYGSGSPARNPASRIVSAGPQPTSVSVPVNEMTAARRVAAMLIGC